MLFVETYHDLSLHLLSTSWYYKNNISKLNLNKISRYNFECESDKMLEIYFSGVGVTYIYYTSLMYFINPIVLVHSQTTRPYIGEQADTLHNYLDYDGETNTHSQDTAFDATTTNQEVDDHLLISAFGVKDNFLKFFRYELNTPSIERKIQLCTSEDCVWSDVIYLRTNMSVVVFGSPFPDKCFGGYTIDIPQRLGYMPQSATILIRNETDRIVDTLEYYCNGNKDSEGTQHRGNDTKYYVNTRSSKSTGGYSLTDHFPQSENDFISFMCGTKNGQKHVFFHFLYEYF